MQWLAHPNHPLSTCVLDMQRASPSCAAHNPAAAALLNHPAQPAHACTHPLTQHLGDDLQRQQRRVGRGQQRRQLSRAQQALQRRGWTGATWRQLSDVGWDTPPLLAEGFAAPPGRHLARTCTPHACCQVLPPNLSPGPALSPPPPPLPPPTHPPHPTPPHPTPHTKPTPPPHPHPPTHHTPPTAAAAQLTCIK